MKYLIIGLGNPGAKYENTRHNIGFKVLDKLASLSNISFSTDKYADVASVKFKGRTLVLIKPNTFMNLSGKAVNYWMQKEKISTENILVISDDISLPFSTIRLRSKGSDGGHNGLKDIINTLGSSAFPRIKFGVGSEFNKGKQSNYVLADWSEEESILLEGELEFIIKMIQSFSAIGINRTMNDFNRR
ncbi:MAG: aminoacyl-tRNA hydrolase [Flavobacteriales bacterium]|jgi:peptidyl-tRNA hydrolase, PTH1 family|nr:aminoacyl-tRNA hydrolase [Flavobacteriales bacterium]